MLISLLLIVILPKWFSKEKVVAIVGIFIVTSIALLAYYRFGKNKEKE